MFIEIGLLLMIIKKNNKYLFLLTIIMVSYFILYKDSIPISNLEIYKFTENIKLMPEIIDKVPF